MGLNEAVDVQSLIIEKFRVFSQVDYAVSLFCIGVSGCMFLRLSLSCFFVGSWKSYCRF
jgi:hypothetical protein